MPITQNKIHVANEIKKATDAGPNDGGSIIEFKGF